MGIRLKIDSIDKHSKEVLFTMFVILACVIQHVTSQYLLAMICINTYFKDVLILRLHYEKFRVLHHGILLFIPLGKATIMILHNLLGEETKNIC